MFGTILAINLGFLGFLADTQKDNREWSVINSRSKWGAGNSHCTTPSIVSVVIAEKKGKENVTNMNNGSLSAP